MLYFVRRGTAGSSSRGNLEGDYYLVSSATFRSFITNSISLFVLLQELAVTLICFLFSFNIVNFLSTEFCYLCIWPGSKGTVILRGDSSKAGYSFLLDWCLENPRLVLHILVGLESPGVFPRDIRDLVVLKVALDGTACLSYWAECVHSSFWRIPCLIAAFLWNLGLNVVSKSFDR